MTTEMSCLMFMLSPSRMPCINIRVCMRNVETNENNTECTQHDPDQVNYFFIFGFRYKIQFIIKPFGVFLPSKELDIIINEKPSFEQLTYFSRVRSVAMATAPMGVILCLL